MRHLLRVLLVLAATLALATAAGADKPDRTAKSDKAAERLERAERRTSDDDGTATSPKVRDADGDGVDDRWAQHPHGGAPGQLKNPGEPAHPEFTAFAETVGAAPTRGRIGVKRPGRDDFVDLTDGRPLPVGTVVDATDGLVEIMSEAAPGGVEQNAVVTGGVFRIVQDRASGITDLRLQGGDFSACKDGDDEDDAPTARSAARRKKGGVARGIWAAGQGRFRTSGRNGAATVRGTRWATVDRCHSTTVKVFEGVVDVKDFGTGRTIAVRAGERHVARERRG
jgi:hypothetical protein